MLLPEGEQRFPAALLLHGYSSSKDWSKALAEAKAAIDWLSNHDDVDASHICATGYSLGSYIALQTAAKDRRIKSVIVAAGGDLPETPWTRMIRLMSDPISAGKKFGCMMRRRNRKLFFGTIADTYSRRRLRTTRTSGFGHFLNRF